MLVLNGLSFDIEDWFHVENLKEAISPDQWESCDLRVVQNTGRAPEAVRDGRDGADIEGGTPAAPAGPATSVTPLTEHKSRVVDPLADVLAELKGEKPAGEASEAAEGGKSIDPLADVMADILKDSKGAVAVAAEARASTLPLGGDKWGRDVAEEDDQGLRDVDLRRSGRGGRGDAARHAVRRACRVLRQVDRRRAFNWFYSVFNSIPYLLLILAVAAVLQQKGMLTIILILGLTGWTGIFRLVRGEYLKHKAREYVQAAAAIGASNVRRMFVQWSSCSEKAGGSWTESAEATTSGKRQ